MSRALKLVLGAVIVVVLIIAITPIIAGPTVGSCLRFLTSNGYTAYATPAGDFYVNNLYPNADSTYDIGASGNQFAEGHFDNLYLYGSSPIALVGAGRVWIELRPDLDFETVRANGKPTWVKRGIVGGWSLPPNEADEELYMEIHAPNRWDNASDIYIHVHCYLDTVNDGKNFNLELAWAHISDGDVIPATSRDLTTETPTGTAAQYTQFHVDFILDYDVVPADPVASSDEIHLRLKRLDASANEAAGEIVVTHVGVVFQRDKLGAIVP